MQKEQQQRAAALFLRVGIYLFLTFVTMVTCASLLYALFGKVIASVFSTLAAALVANLVTLKTSEDLHLIDVGLRWNARHLLLGLAGGCGAASLALTPPLLLGAAYLQPDHGNPLSAATVLFTVLVLVIGAASEELLFRGYAFQLLARRVGAIVTITAISLLFGWGHTANPHATWLGVVNTALWGAVLGAAVIRSRDLWLAIGLHFGWNVTLPLFGVPVSGLTIRLTGHAMRWRVGELWSGGEYGVEASALTLFVLPLLGWYLYKAPVVPQSNPILLAPVEE